MEFTRVEGENRGDVKLYAISTCGWCGKTKRLLRDLGVEFSYVDVDLLGGDDKQEIVSEIERWNPRKSFPTIVIDNDRCIVGFKEDQIRGALG